MKTIGKYFAPLLFALFGLGLMIHAIIRDPSSWSTAAWFGAFFIVLGYCFAILRDDILLPPPLRGHLEITETTWEYKPPRFLKFLATFILMPFAVAVMGAICIPLFDALRLKLAQGSDSPSFTELNIGPWQWILALCLLSFVYLWVIHLRRFFSHDSGYISYTPEEFKGTVHRTQNIILEHPQKSDFRFRLLSSRGIDLGWMLYVESPDLVRFNPVDQKVKPFRRGPARLSPYTSLITMKSNRWKKSYAQRLVIPLRPKCFSAAQSLKCQC